MDKIKILVTGATGFIGRAFLKRLDQNIFDVYALSNEALPESALGGLKNFYLQDISRRFRLNQTFDFVFHLAAYNVTHVGEQSPDVYEKINVQGTRHILESAEIRNFVFMSTAKVYKPEGIPITEASPLSPDTDYAESKLRAEELCGKHFQGNRLTILRSVNIVGPGQEPKAVIPVFFGRAMKNLPLTVFVPRELVLQLLDIEDLLNVFEQILKKEGVPGIFNVSSKDHLTVEDVAREIVKLCGSESKIDFTSHDLAVFSPIVSEKISTMLGWAPQITIRKSLKNYWQSVQS